MRSFLSYLALSILFISCNESERLDPSPPDAGKGKMIFQENCASCHHVQKKLVGPPLAGTMNFWKNRQDLYDYIHNPEAYLKTRNDERMNRLHDEYKLMMPGFPYLSEKDIDAIVMYLEQGEAK